MWPPIAADPPMPLPIPKPLPPYLQCRPSLLRPRIDLQLLKRASEGEMKALKDSHFGMSLPEDWEVSTLVSGLDIWTVMFGDRSVRGSSPKINRTLT